MRKERVAIGVLAVLLALSGTARAAGKVYADPESGVSFTVPAGWTEEPDEDSEYVAYTASLQENGDYFQISFGCMDLWNEMPASAKTGYSRADANNSLYTPAELEAEYGADSVTTVYFNNVMYFKLIMPDQTVSSGGITVTVNLMILINIQNGIQYMFSYLWYADMNRHYGDFTALMNSVEYPASSVSASSGAPKTSQATPARTNPYAYSSSTGNSSGLNLGAILLSLIVTIAVYSLPIIVYRYGIRKRPMEPKPARRVTIIWAIVGFIIITLIVYALDGSSGATGGGILLWSYVNYRMLTGGEDRSPVSEPSPRYSTITGPNGRARYRGNVLGDRFEGAGTLYNGRGDIIYSGMFSQGFFDETPEARAQRLVSFKQSCVSTAMQDIYEAAQAGAGMHVCLRGRVFQYNSGKTPDEYGFLMYFEDAQYPDAVLGVNYHLGAGEGRVCAGRTATVWGSVEGMASSGVAGEMIPYIEAWDVQDEGAWDTAHPRDV